VCLIKWLCKCISMSMMVFWHDSIITCFFDVIMSIFFELMMFTLTNILAQRLSTRWASHIITTLTSCWLVVSVRCIDTITYLLIICLLKLISYTDMSVVIVWIFTLLHWDLKKVLSSKMTKHSMFKQIDFAVTSFKSCTLIIM